MTIVSLNMHIEPYVEALDMSGYLPQPLVDIVIDYIKKKPGITVVQVIIPEGENPFDYGRRNQLLDKDENEVNILCATFRVSQSMFIPNYPQSRIVEIANEFKQRLARVERDFPLDPCLKAKAFNNWVLLDSICTFMCPWLNHAKLFPKNIKFDGLDLDS